jgi:D-2-hydroxyacid dehydrogenase (NADP+)
MISDATPDHQPDPMTNVLILLATSDAIRAAYAKALTDAFPQVTVATVDHHSKAEKLIGETDILLTFGPLVTPRLIEKASRLKWIQSLGTGMDGLVDQPALRGDVILTRIHGIVEPMCETIIASMLALGRNMRRSFDNQARQVWARHPPQLLYGKTLGILGVGAIASALAPRCKVLGLEVIGLSSVPRPLAGFDAVLPIGELETAAARFDHLVILTPYSPATHHIVHAGVLAAMKPTAFIVNVARGGVLDEAALIEALDQGRIAGAALDVFQEEPLPAGHRLWSMPNVIVTPHTGGTCDTYPELVMPTVLDNMRLFLAGQPERMINRVANPRHA